MSGFDNVALPGLEPDAPEHVRQPKKVDPKAPPAYRRWKPTTRIHCADCLEGRVENVSAPLSQASYLRITAREERPLCFLHKQQAMHRDFLG